jgi:aryl-alcohol dehydrogenase-like predicted oxidoreductase
VSAVLGLGLAAVGRPGYLNVGHADDLGPDRSVEALERRTHELLDAARAAGLRHFDAARSYGRAEEFLGSWLRSRAIAPGELVISSKWGYTYTADWQVDADPPEVKDLSLATFRRQLGETRANLGDHLSLYQIHSATIESGVLDDDDLLAALAELRASGVQVGLSVTGAAQAATIDRAVALGAFDSVQATWNPLEPSAGPALERAHASGMRTMLKETLANGRLTARAGAATTDAVVLAAALAQPWADVVLSGAATRDQLHSNLGAREVTLDDAARAQLAALAEPPERYWSERSALAWT